MRNELKSDVRHVDGETGQISINEQLRYLLDSVPELIFLKDVEGRFTYLNATAMTVLGKDEQWASTGDKTIFDILSADKAAHITAWERRVMDQGHGVHDFEEAVSINGNPRRWFSGIKTPLLDETGCVTGIAGIIRDVTEVKRQETLRKGHASLLEMIVRGKPLAAILTALVETVEDLLDNVKGAVMLFDEDAQMLRNAAAPNLPPSYVSLIDGFKIGPKTGSCGTAAWRREAVYVCDTFQDPLWQHAVEVVMRHGLRSCWSTPIMGSGGLLLGTFALYSGTVREPTQMDREIIDMATNIAGIAIDRRRTEEHAQFMAHHDPLTGLPNRTLFWTQFSRALHEAKREHRMVAVSYIDLDDFKQVNDIHGHAAGDEVLRSVANRIIGCIRASDIAVRLGGDEFAIVFSNPKYDEAGIVARLEKIRESISQPIAIEKGSLFVTCSLGIAFYPNDGDTPEALLAKADAAMYTAKKSGRNRVSLFDECGGGI
jgi:diguanylate cyclase (GGDEF)-like protein/PAS domain S-box-containing protein